MPLIVVSAFGAMQEGFFIFNAMAKTSAVLNSLEKKKNTLISLLTDPTTGGVFASISMLGDIILVEPGALVGFAGPRVIQQTIKQIYPKDFKKQNFYSNTE